MSRSSPLDTADPLFDEPVSRALAEIPADAGELEIATRLRKLLAAPLARRAAEQLALRRRAERRFGQGTFAFLTRKGLEQATPAAVAHLRARLFREAAPRATVLDATCGIGADTIALVTAGLSVVAADIDPFTLRCARANLARRGGGASFLLADAKAPAVRADLLLLDPDRRAGGERSLEPEEWSPPWTAARTAASAFGGACIKLPPALDPGSWNLPEPARLRWISLKGELVEVGVWSGTLAAGRTDREALVVDGSGNVSSLAGDPMEIAPLGPEAARAVAWLAEPDPAIIRSGLLGVLARATGMTPLAASIAYLGGAERPDSPFLRAWRVLGSVPLDRRRVRALLLTHDVGPLTIKKRGHPEPAAALARRLRGAGSRPGLLAVTRLDDGHQAYLLETAAPAR